MPVKIWVPLILILSGISWLAFSNLSKANYFYPVDELPQWGNGVYEHNLRIKGRVVAGSIEAATKPVKFVIHENDAQVAVSYVGDEPLPDMFKDRAEAVVDGRMVADGVFEATHLQAKCASKYEAAAPETAEGSADYQKPAYPAPAATERTE
jgi:cytochrome c-type biogenesis protein CcmE